MPGAGVDHVPPALTAPPPTRPDLWRRAVGWAPLILGVDEPVALSPLSHPGARIILHATTTLLPWSP